MIRFCAQNWVDGLAAGYLTASSAVADLPVTNLQHPHRRNMWRSTSHTGQWVKADLRERKDIDYIAIVDHNLTSTGTITITASNSSDMSSPVYSGTHAAHTLYPWPTNRGVIRVIVLPSIVDARYWLISFTDASSTDLYIEAGRIFIGQSFVPSNNIDFGWRLIAEDRSQVSYADSGTPYTAIYPNRSMIEITASQVDYTDLYSALLPIMDEFGCRKDFILSVVDTQEPSGHAWTTIYGRLTKDSMSEARSFQFGFVGITMVESL